MLKFLQVSKSFGTIPALVDISFDVIPGEFVFITGPSGAGKTTLLNLILRRYLPDTGEIYFGEADITKLRRRDIPALRQKIGMVFQDFKVLPERTVNENIEVALAVHGVDQRSWGERISQVLSLVGLAERADLFPSQLSGGELQRVSLARALVTNPELVLADEPTGNLDWETADSIMDLFDKIHQTGKTVVVATHHQGIVGRMKKRVIKLKEGRIAGVDGKKPEKPKAEQKPKEVVNVPVNEVKSK